VQVFIVIDFNQYKIKSQSLCSGSYYYLSAKTKLDPEV